MAQPPFEITLAPARQQKMPPRPPAYPPAVPPYQQPTYHVDEWGAPARFVQSPAIAYTTSHLQQQQQQQQQAPSIPALGASSSSQPASIADLALINSRKLDLILEKLDAEDRRGRQGQSMEARVLAALEALRQEVLGRCSTTIVNIDQSISHSSVGLAHGASITNIDQSAPFAHSSIGYGSTVNAATATTLNANPAVTNIDQSSPITNMNNSSIGFASMAHRSSSMTHGTTALRLGPPPATALAPPASSSSSYSTEPASAEAIAAIHRKLDAVLEQMGAMVSRDAMVSYVTQQLQESEGRAAAAQHSLEARVMAAVDALRQELLAQQQQQPTLEDLEGY